MKTCNKCGEESANNARYCSGCGYELSKSIASEMRHRGAEPEKKSLKKQVTGTIVGTVSFVVVYLIMQQFVFKAPSIDKVLMEAVNEMNKVCPMMVDSLTRLDNTIALPSKTFQNNYTLGFAKEDVDLSIFQSNMELVILNNSRTNPDLQFFRDRDVTIKHFYKDFEGNHLFTITVTPSQYK
ncbi:MAG: hypothetical protein FWD56_05215 [Bacteroidales bacterium]|nr:hypothetical protein [Bacteroidales bacterium]